MLQAAFDKLTVGSTVNLKGYLIFQGMVKDIQKDKGLTLVDFLPNIMTGGGDPEPYWEHYSRLEVVTYAEVMPDIEYDLKIVIQKWALYSQQLNTEILNFMKKWKL